MALQLVTSLGNKVSKSRRSRSKVSITELIIAREYYRWVDYRPEVVVIMSTALCEGKGIDRAVSSLLFEYLKGVDKERLERV